jgi:flagellar biogenesis protein FliO
MAVLFVLRRQGTASLAGLRPTRGATPRRLEVIERLPLSAQHSLHLIRLDGRTLLLGLYPGGCNLLTAAEADRNLESPQ